jgi:phosphoglycerate kinase
MTKVTTERLIPWLNRLLGLMPRDNDLKAYLNDIPRLESLADVPSGTSVLIRGDVDAKPGANVGEGDVRLRSMVATLEYGRLKGWKQVIFGHIGRKPEGSLEKVAKRLGELLKTEVPLVKNWLDEQNLTVTDEAHDFIKAAAPGSVIVLENTRAYGIETVLWKAKTEADTAKLAPKLAAFATTMAERVGRVYINEALSAGSLDSSSTVVPAAMDRVALGRYVANEFAGPMLQCLDAQFVVFSGIKIDKLDDLEAMINRGKITHVLSAGSLAMALKKASAQLDGGDFSLGNSEDPSHSDKPYYIPPDRIEQAKRMIQHGRQQGIEFILPVDFILADGSASDTIGAGQQQFDIGPKTIAYFDQKIGEFMQAATTKPQPVIAFHNGVFGMFEDARFENGTKSFMAQLKRMKDAGILVYVGGGEGGTALEKYGQTDWVTHVFTAGGTVLNALGSEPIPYLVALRMAAKP